jgi:two-component system, cell cycle response regulator DivK
LSLILVVEDFLDARELYAEYLTYAGFQVVTAINGHDAVRQAGFFRPDLILMDIRMPGMDGMEAAADVKANPALAGIPIIAITADPSPEVAARAIEAGCVTCLAKPVLPDVLVATISRVLKLES